MDEPTQQRPNTKRPILLLLFIVFGLPIILAVYYFSKGEPIGKTTNRGELIDPMKVEPLQLSDLNGNAIEPKELGGKWTLVYIPTKHCTDECLEKLYFLRQIQTAMGKRQNSLRRSALVFANQDIDPQLKEIIKQQYPKTNLWVSQANILVNKKTNQELTFQEHHIYIIDPHANIMMHYNADVDPNDILKDLGKLVRD